MTKIRINKSLLAAILLLVILLASIMLQTNPTIPKSSRREHVSFIVYGDDAERWENMRQGAEIVCKEKNADISLITMLSENDEKEQIEIIDREIADGADTLIIAACNSSAVAEHVRKRKVSTVFVESMEAFDWNGYSVLAPDDYKIGYELGEEIVKNESDIVTVAIISEHMEKDSVALREKGLRDAIEGKVGRILNWERNEKQKNANIRTVIQREIVSEATDVIVTFDNSATDALLDAMSNLNKKSKVYATSTSDKAVYNLYNGEIKALEYTNEFSMGYLAAMYALDRTEARRHYSGKEIEHKLVRKEDMYDKDNQTLLFPFVN